jgi:hypothetical protein
MPSDRSNDDVIPLRNSEIEWNRNWQEFRLIPSNFGRESVPTIPELVELTTELRYDPIPELLEFIPGTELIPQCATSRNRMYSPKVTMFYKVWPKVFGVEISETNDDFWNERLFNPSEYHHYSISLPTNTSWYWCYQIPSLGIESRG